MQRAALLYLGITSPLILLLFVAPLPFGEEIFTVVMAGYPIALMVMGASRKERLGPVAWPLGTLLLILVGVMLGMLAFRGRVEDGPWIGPFPAGAAFLLYGLFLLPVLVSALGYAFTFESWSLRDEDLKDLRRRFGGKKGEGEKR